MGESAVIYYNTNVYIMPGAHNRKGVHNSVVYTLEQHMNLVALQKQHCYFDTSMVTTVALQLGPSSVHGGNVHGRNYISGELLSVNNSQF